MQTKTSVATPVSTSHIFQLSARSEWLMIAGNCWGDRLAGGRKHSQAEWLASPLWCCCLTHWLRLQNCPVLAVIMTSDVLSVISGRPPACEEIVPQWPTSESDAYSWYPVEEDLLLCFYEKSKNSLMEKLRERLRVKKAQLSVLHILLSRTLKYW